MPIIKYEGKNDLTVDSNNNLNNVIRIFAGLLFTDGYSMDSILESMDMFVSSERIWPEPEIKKLEC